MYLQQVSLTRKQYMLVLWRQKYSKNGYEIVSFSNKLYLYRFGLLIGMSVFPAKSSQKMDNLAKRPLARILYTMPVVAKAKAEAPRNKCLTI